MGDNMMILETSICDKASFLATILFIKKLVNIISIIIPIILILLLSIDFAKAVIASDDNQMKKAQKLAIKRIIIGAVVFFVPLVVNAVFSLFDGKEVAGLSCYNNATDEVVDVLTAAENEKLLLYAEDIKALIEAAKESQAAADAKLEEIRDKKTNHGGQNSGNNNNQDSPVTEVASKVLTSADKVAHGLADNHFKYVYSSKYKSYSSALKNKYLKTNCAQYVVWSFIDAGVMAPGDSFFFKKGKYGSASAKKTLKRYEKAGRIKIYYKVNKKLKNLIESGQVQPGDALANTDQTHTFIYAGKKNGTYTFYTVGTNGKDGFTYNEIYRTDLHTKYGNKTIGAIVRPLKTN